MICITLYCTRFFYSCQEKFYAFYKKTENFSKGQQEKPKDSPNQLPKSGKNRPQELPCGLVPQDATEKESGTAAQAQIASAHAKPQHQPRIKAGNDKNKICQSRKPGTQWPQKTVKKPKPRA